MKFRRTCAVCFVAASVIAAASCGSSDREGGVAADPEEESPRSTAGQSSDPGTSASGGTSGSDTVASDSTPDSSSDWADIVAKAKEEGVVYFYGGTTSDWVEIEEAFETDFPEIDMRTTVMTTSDMVARLDQERDLAEQGSKPSSDVAATTSPQWFADAGDEGSLLSLQLSPEVEQAWAGIDQYASNTSKVMSYTPYAITFNTVLLEELGIDGIDDAEDLLNPALVGNICGVDAGSAPVTAYQYFVYSQVLGDDFLRQFGEMSPIIVPASSQAIADLAAGECAVAVATAPRAVRDAQAQGAPLDYIVTTESVLIPYTVAAVQWAEHPNASLVLIDWLLTSHGNQVVQDDILGVSALPGTNTELVGVENLDDFPADSFFDPAANWPTETYNAWLASDWQTVIQGG